MAKITTTAVPKVDPPWGQNLDQGGGQISITQMAQTWTNPVAKTRSPLGRKGRPGRWPKLDHPGGQNLDPDGGQNLDPAGGQNVDPSGGQNCITPVATTSARPVAKNGSPR